jgi:hypothetical protein
MIHVTVALAVAAAIVTQGAASLRSGHYSGLHKIIKPTAPHELKQVRPPGASAGARRAELAVRQQGLQPGPCGMPIIAADASIDPKIIVPLPESRQSEAVIRQAEPPPCGPFTLVPAHRPVPVEGIRRDRR